MALLKGAIKATVQMPQQTEDNGDEGQGGGNTKTKTSKKKSPSKDSDNRLPARASGPNLMTKYQFLVGRDWIAWWQILR